MRLQEKTLLPVMEMVLQVVARPVEKQSASLFALLEWSRNG